MTTYALDLTVVVPLYEEEDNVDAVVAEVLAVLDDMPHSSELVLVDDGSSDATGALAMAWAKRDPRVRVIQFRRNYGQTAAIQAGFDASRGAVVVLMDGDQQNDPHDIPRLLDKMADGYDVVSGWRKNRQDRTLSRKLPSRVANRMISRFTGTELHDYGCTLKAYSAEIVHELRLYGELHRFIPALAAMSGARVAELSVNHRPRLHGRSKYGIGRAPRVLLDLITVKFMLRYLTKPMQLFGKWGLVCAGLSLIGVMFLIGEKAFGDHALANRPLLLLSCVGLICGIVLFCVGLLGELVTRIYHEGGSPRPNYTVRPDVGPGDEDTIFPNHVVDAPPVPLPAEQ
jgi:glycosyltransferase involved in cell wall biosynthesis